MKMEPVMVLLFIIAQIVGIALLARFVSEAGLAPEAQFAFSLVIGVVVLMTTLFILASGFAQLNLTDPRAALGLPEGSIRAIIALILILVFIMFGTFLYNQESTWAKLVGPIEMPRDAWLNLDNVQSARQIGDTDRYAVMLLRTTSEGLSRLAQQLLTTVGTLVVAVAGFYFGSATFASGAGRRNRESVVETPVIESVEPQAVQRDRR